MFVIFAIQCSSVYNDTLMGQIPNYPNMAAIELSLRSDLQRRLAGLSSGVSELTFANLFLFRMKHKYCICELSDGRLLIQSGSDFIFPEGLPSREMLLELLANHPDVRSIRCLCEDDLAEGRESIESLGGIIIADRDNYDYVYRCSDLSTLQGRHYHKKRNHTNAFQKLYDSTSFVLDKQRAADARAVLESWHEHHQNIADYEESGEALSYMDELDLSGHIIYVDDIPVAYALGEHIAQHKQFVIHYEKARIEYRGVYQYLNMNFAAALCGSIKLINLEQDLGNEGIRQSKLTYRPLFFVRKYRVHFDIAKQYTI